MTYRYFNCRICTYLYQLACSSGTNWLDFRKSHMFGPAVIIIKWVHHNAQLSVWLKKYEGLAYTSAIFMCKCTEVSVVRPPRRMVNLFGNKSSPPCAPPQYQSVASRWHARRVVIPDAETAHSTLEHLSQSAT